LGTVKVRKFLLSKSLKVRYIEVAASCIALPSPVHMAHLLEPLRHTKDIHELYRAETKALAA
jgi:hypothetical protein